MTPGPAWLILPTYDEAENVERDRARRAARARARRAATATGSSIVDDDSPDGTGEIADRLAAELDEVEVLHRDRADRASARRTSPASRTRSTRGAGLVLEMDADFSHDPADVARLIAAVADGADLALGSRYVAGGGVRDWGRVRRLVSRGGCLYAQARARRCRVRDLTGGFKCFRREVLEAIDLPTVRSQRLRVPGRADLPRAARAASASSRCRSCSATASSGARR